MKKNEDSFPFIELPLMSYSDAIRTIRKYRGITLKRAAEIFGMTERQLSKCEKDESSLMVSTYLKMCEFYNFSIRGSAIVRDERLLEDVNCYYLIKYYIACEIRAEFEANLFANDVEEIPIFYEEKFRARLSEAAAEPIYNLHFPGFYEAWEKDENKTLSYSVWDDV